MGLNLMIQTKNFRVTKNLFINNSISLNLGKNNNFCKSILRKTNISNTIFDENILPKPDFVYNLNRFNFDYAKLDSIMDLLLQLKANQDDQNSIFQNNTVVKQQILDQLKNEVVRVQNGLTKTQTEKLKVVSNNNFDVKTLDQLLKSLSEDSKKKIDKKKIIKNEIVNLTEEKNNISKKIVNKTGNLTNFINNKENFIDNIYKTNVEHIKKLLKNNLKENVFEFFCSGNYDKILSNSLEDILNKVKTSKFNLINKDNVNNIKNNVLKTNKNLIKQNNIRKINNNLFLEDILNTKKIKVTESNHNKSTKASTLVSETEKIFLKNITKANVRNLIEKRKYKDLENSKYFNLNRKIIEIKKIKEKHVELENLEKLVNKNKLIHARDLAKKSIISNLNTKEIKLDKKIDILANVINKNLMSEILSDKKILDIRNVKTNIFKKFKTRVIDLKKKKLEIKSKNQYEKDLRTIQENELKLKNSENVVTKISKVKNTLDLISKISKSNSIIKVFSERKNIETINNLINKKSYLSIDRINKKNISESVKNFFEVRENKKEIIKKLDLSSSITKNIISKKNKIFEKVNENINKFIKNKIENSIKTKIKKTFLNNYANIRNFESNIIYKTSKNKIIVDRNLKTITKNEFLNKNYELEKNILNKKSIIKNIFSHKNKIFEKVNENISKFVKVKTKNGIKTKSKKIFVNDYTGAKDFESNLIYQKSKNKVIAGEKLKTVTKNEILNKDYELEKNILNKKLTVTNKKSIKRKSKKAVENIINNILKTNNKNILKTNKIISSLETKNVDIHDFYNLTLKNNIQKIKKAKNFVSKRKTKFFSSKILASRIFRTENKNLYRDIIQNKLFYYNDSAENVNNNNLVKETYLFNNKNFYRNLEYKKMAHKDPIPLKKIINSEIEKSKKVKTKKEKDPDIKFIKKVIDSPKNMNNKFLYPNNSKLKFKEKHLSEDDVKDIIRSYMSDLNIENISQIILDKVDQKMRLDKKRKGIF
ncbi:MAG: hypothetical protein RsTaC01_0985 [Candidatus Paraimprobicoccus trichonymphae]|uniref:Uncharacterized protein n=1 Tax=Candidatus Paraimprobicoccus trichonymphae TaxID=3033793 RepID=A0AA48KZM8_9FIRM|nr:MAG: hypothetical protein RsTaC01_0985 [Candidatus Paraimprobicoccus trichonymphae]